MKTLTIVLRLAVLICMIIVVGCGQQAGITGEDSKASDVPQLVLTEKELAEYNGKDGKPAYIVVDSVIYDVTDVPFWKNGEHNGYSAGKDLTHEIKNVSPHGVSKLSGLPVAGSLKN